MPREKDVEQLLETSEQRLVDKKNILQKGDWLLKWRPSNSNGVQTGFELYTPPEYNATSTTIPLGGTVLAAIYFMLEFSGDNFAGEMIARANQLAEEINGGPVDTKPTLN